MTRRAVRVIGGTLAVAALFAGPGLLAARVVDDDTTEAAIAQGWRLAEAAGAPVGGQSRKLAVQGVSGRRQQAECRPGGATGWTCVAATPSGDAIAAVWVAPAPGLAGARVLRQDDDPETVPNR